MKTYLISELTPAIINSGTHLVLLLARCYDMDVKVVASQRSTWSQDGDGVARLAAGGWEYRDPTRAYPATVSIDGNIVPVETTDEPTHVWRFEGAYDLPDGQPQHGDISLTERSTHDGWRALKILARYNGPFIPRLNRRRQWLLCEDGVALLDGAPHSGTPFDWISGIGIRAQWLLRVNAGNEYHLFTLRECAEMPILLDAIDVHGLEVMK